MDETTDTTFQRNRILHQVEFCMAAMAAGYKLVVFLWCCPYEVLLSGIFTALASSYRRTLSLLFVCHTCNLFQLPHGAS